MTLSAREVQAALQNWPSRPTALPADVIEPQQVVVADNATDSQQDQKVNQQASLRPHAQAHLLSSTENCKVGAQLAISLSSTATTVTSAVSSSSTAFEALASLASSH